MDLRVIISLTSSRAARARQGQGSARDLNEPSRARQSSARKAREQVYYYFILKKKLY